MKGQDMKPDGLGTHETCSWCTTEVRWASLRETNEGNLCPDCLAEYRAEREVNSAFTYHQRQR